MISAFIFIFSIVQKWKVIDRMMLIFYVWSFVAFSDKLIGESNHSKLIRIWDYIIYIDICHYLLVEAEKQQMWMASSW